MYQLHSRLRVLINLPLVVFIAIPWGADKGSPEKEILLFALLFYLVAHPGCYTVIESIPGLGCRKLAGEHIAEN